MRVVHGAWCGASWWGVMARGAWRLAAGGWQVHGVVHDTIRFVDEILTVELNSATDNPMIFGAHAALPSLCLPALSAHSPSPSPSIFPPLPLSSLSELQQKEIHK